MNKPINIGTTIRTARKALGLRQDQLAAAAGVGVRFLVELERGKPTVQLGRTLNVLTALGLDVHIAPRPPLPELMARGSLELGFGPTKSGDSNTR